MVLVVMGVSGSGKSTVGSAIAAKLGWPFRDGDDFHPPANRAKMSQGIPLVDEDRWPWLDAIAQFARETEKNAGNAVVACSALKQAYRDRLHAGCGDMRFIYLHGTRELLAERMNARTGHFMPPSLLTSQLATLEPPADAVWVDIALPPAEIVSEVISKLGIS
ncbi:MAG TPA: gluconokinase [Candidatus Limnocylindria bacterium]|jgi:carbohydrate kinase (thermoresistant glucokinase family)|nr:gluconokinase [Candidatus Limnocylindria bacterium]